MSPHVLNYRDHVGVKAEKFYKTTLFQGETLMIGLNCLEPGQVQAVHAHAGQDKFYFVLEGVGRFTIDQEIVEAGPGHVIWAAAEAPHGVENPGAERLILLMGLAPPPHQ